MIETNLSSYRNAPEQSHETRGYSNYMTRLSSDLDVKVPLSSLT